LTIQRIQSKLAKTNVLLLQETVRNFIPTTKKWSRETLLSMLNLYSMIYVKPNLGTYGKGVIRVEKIADASYRFQLGTQVYRCASFAELYKALLRHKSRGVYVIQRGIHLLKHHKRRFDIRVMLQKNKKDDWEATGIIGRLAHPSKIVTNYHSGGTPMSFSDLMSTHLTKSEQTDYIQRLNKLGLTVARQLQTKYPGLKELGLDVAIDTDLHPWILEVNSCPDPFIFRKLQDKSVFHKIYRYAVAYGKFKTKQKK
jgi:glutathione synthase/RimK-type ligase-like ATP-grasp enzyme